MKTRVIAVAKIATRTVLAVGLFVSTAWIVAMGYAIMDQSGPIFQVIGDFHHGAMDQ